MKALKIISCSDPMMWYRAHIGKVVPLLQIDSQVYLSREPAGYSNIVHKHDAEIVDAEMKDVLYAREHDRRYE